MGPLAPYPPRHTRAELSRRAALWCALLMLVASGWSGAVSAAEADIFTEIERAIIERYARRLDTMSSEAVSPSPKQGKAKGHGKPKGKYKNKQLPPGLARRDQLPPGLARRETLPPGLQREPLPDDLASSLPPPRHGTERILVDGRAVLIERATNRVLDVLEDIIIRGL